MDCLVPNFLKDYLDSNGQKKKILKQMMRIKINWKLDSEKTV